jgi:hypothetical protein
MILGLTGKMGSGKDTAMLRLQELVTIPVEQISFAKKLKESAAACFGRQISADDLNRWKNNPEARVVIIDGYEQMLFSKNAHVAADVTIREFLQFHGTEAHRDIFGDNFWVDAAMPPETSRVWALDQTKLYVVTDVRFPNERDRVQDRQGIVARITGPNEDTGAHTSEQVLEGIDWEIDNSIRDDDFAWLDSQLKSMLYANHMGSIIKYVADVPGEVFQVLL